MNATGALQAGRPIPEMTRRAILAAAGSGLSLRALANKHGVSNPTVLRVWRRAGINPAKLAERNALVESHRWLADRIARSVGRNLPAQLREELESTAIVALTECAGVFDAARGVAFAMYAQQRIRGACLDSIRRRHYVNGTAAEYAREDSESRTEEAPDAEARMINVQQRARIIGAIDQLPGRYAVLIFLHYIDGRSLEHIAPTLGVGASRLSQLHREGLQMLKERMKTT